MTQLYIDSETFSPVPIGNGLTNYASEVEVLLVSYAFDEEPVHLWDVLAGEPQPKILREAMRDREVKLIAHQSSFDRTVFTYTNCFPDAYLAPDRWIDTMAQALAHGLPGGLDALCKIFGLSEAEAKDKKGRTLIHLFCKPDKKGNRATHLTHPEQWQVFREYAKSDITSMRIIHKKMPRWNYPDGDDYAIWLLDQQINERGVYVDLDLAQTAVEAEAEEKLHLNAATQRATEDENGNAEVQAATQRDELLKHIVKAYGVTLPDMKADTLQRRINDESLPLPLRELLALRVQSSRNAAAKYKAVLKGASADGRLRHSLQFCGAATTGRWSGRVFQPQNLMRPTMSNPDIETAICDIKSGSVTMFYPDVPKVLGNCVRGVIVAPPGKKLIACDLSSIEGRKLAWLAGEQKIVDFYRAVDAGEVDYDSYMLAYALCFGIDPADVTKAQRILGKPIDLAHGYGGGVAAFLTFALTYHLDLQEVAEAVWATGNRQLLNHCNDKYTWAKEKGFDAGLPQFQYAAFEYVKTKWRDARPKTVQFWAALKDAFANATHFEKQIFTAGPIKFMRTGHWMRARLPSGRQLVFLQPKADASGLTYAGLNRYTRKWGRVYTHGGKLSGIITQAAASDILRAALPKLEAEGYATVLTVHDEAICEVPDTGDYTVKRVAELMTEPLSWAPGLPLSADGFETYRYRKDG